MFVPAAGVPAAPGVPAVLLSSAASVERRLMLYVVAFAGEALELCGWCAEPSEGRCVDGVKDGDEVLSMVGTRL